MAKPRTRLRLASSAQMKSQLNVAPTELVATLYSAIAIEIELLRSREPRTANGKP